ncbi:MAG: hypothetical protein ACI97A_001896 [Planctomycetota bacterium]
MRSLANGEKGYENFPKMLKKKFVFLNVYCTSVADEHKPRGPEGPYQFNDKSVPVFLVKRWSGETFKQQLGFGSGPAATKGVARELENAIKKNGPVTPPKALKPLNKGWKKASGYLAKKKPGYAWKELAKVVALAENKKKFPGGLPTVGQEAKDALVKLGSAFDKALKEAVDAGANDPAAASKAMKKMMKTYSMVKDLKLALSAALKELPKK